MREYINRGKFVVNLACQHGSHLLYWSVRSFSKSEGDRLKGLDRVIVVLASCVHHFIRVHKNLVQYSSNYISITFKNMNFCKQDNTAICVILVTF